MKDDQQVSPAGTRSDQDAEQYRRMLEIQVELLDKYPVEPAAAQRFAGKRRSGRYAAIIAGAGLLLAAAAVTAGATLSGGQAAGAQSEPDSSATVAPAPVTPISAARPIAPAARVVLDDATLPFKSDSAELVDGQTAKEQLSAIAESVKASRSQVTLTGTTATDGSESGRAQLSLARAKAVKVILISLGVSESQITTKGVGIHHPSHINDRDKSGKLIPELAAKNRTVVLTVQSS